MGLMTSALKTLSGRRVAAGLGRLTRNRFTAMATGAAATALVQSSSVTTVLVVGLVSAGSLSLAQSVGVVLGANVGTTITAQLIAFPVARYALLFVALGFGLPLAVRREGMDRIGQAILALGLVFLGMDLMSTAMAPLRDHGPFLGLLRAAGHPLAGVALGAAFTALIQSSSAATGIVIVLAGQGMIGLEAAIAIVMGANVGTCVTAWLASLGRPVEARQVALVHVLFNVVGVVVWLGFVPHLAAWAAALAPAPEGTASANGVAALPRQVAHAHTIFNVSTTVLLLGFTTPIAALARRLVPSRPALEPEGSTPKFLDRMYLSAPSMALQQARREIVRLAGLVRPMLASAVTTVADGTARMLQDWVGRQEAPRRLHEHILTYLAALSRQDLDPTDAAALTQLMTAADHVENVVDTLATNVALVARERIAHGLAFSTETQAGFEALAALALLDLDDATASLDAVDVARAQAVLDRKTEANRRATVLKNRLARRLIADEPYRLTIYRLESDLLEHLRRISWACRRVAQVVVEGAGNLRPAAGPPVARPPEDGDVPT